MREYMHHFLLTSVLFFTPVLPVLHLSGNTSSFQGIIDTKVKPSQDTPQEASAAKSDQNFEPFTGKITRNKVRMRLQPSLEAPILCELTRDDLLNIVGESNEFYVILPPPDTRAYIFRTFVLDNSVEGNRVNVRLEPALEAPIIAQLNTGDRVDGVISPLSSKWLEINPPLSTRFYVCKEYVENIGSPSMMAQIEKRRTEVTALLNSAQVMSENELQKNYKDVNLDTAIAHLNNVIKHYQDFPQCVERAKELLSNIQETHLQKKIYYLEARALNAESSHQQAVKTAASLQAEIARTRKEEIALASPSLAIEEKTLSTMSDAAPNESYLETPNWNDPFNTKAMTTKMAIWLPAERALYETWATGNSEAHPQNFYENQFSETVTLHGVLEPYARTVKNKPGDYLLVSPSTALPIAYLYSTRVNLQENVGHEVTLHALKRPNNNFAFPAYFVISIE